MDSKLIRKNILLNSFKAKACHVGSSLSCVEILMAIYDILGEKDVFLFSKASGACALYEVLAQKGIINESEVAEFLAKYPLASKEVPGVVHSVGSIGHGLNVAVGMAYADRTRKVYCLISDGELNEGSTWEAIMFAGHHKLGNLIVVVDYNGLQACGKTDEILELDSIPNKIQSFRWNANVVYDGHDEERLKSALLYVDEYSEDDKPVLVTAHTTKGKGVSEIQDDYTWHYKNITEEQLNRWI